MAKTRTKEATLARALMSATTEDDVRAILRLAKGLYGDLRRRPVGDRPNNIGTIGMGSDPALGIVERITNAMDDVLDLGSARHPNDVPATPREAAQTWYGVPAGGLAEMSDAKRRTLGENIQVWLDESGEAKRPTVVVEDHGLGQSPARFPTTLLSLNEQNKVAQTWNMGTYGQGGAVTFSFCAATIIISRRHPDFTNGEPDSVGWTVVQRYEDPSAQQYPSYKYLVGSDDNVLDLDPGLFPDLPHGTRVIHIAYDLQGWTGPFTTGLWQFSHAALFDPVLPFLITGKRKKERAYGSRIVIGNAARLERPDKARGDLEIAHKDSVRFDMKDGDRLGHVTFNYWVLRRPEGSASTAEPAAGYVRADAAVSMTLFGQRQDTEPRAWIKDNAKLPFIYKNMVVQIQADTLTPVAKSDIFASTRERAKKSDLRALIYDRLAFILRNDEDLKRLNSEEKERLLARSAASSSEKVRKRLAAFIKTRLKSVTKPGTSGTAGDGETKKRKTHNGGRSEPRDIDDSALPNVPTQLKFKNDRVRVYQGARGYTWVEINAKNGYLPAHDDDLSLTWDGTDPGLKLRLALRSKVLGGRSRWYFESDTDASVGEFTFRATLYTPNGVLTDTVAVVVASPPPAKPDTPGTEPETGPRVQWVWKHEWAEHGGNLGPNIVGYVTEDEDETIIWVNRDFDSLVKALSGRDLTPEAIETRATRYQFPIACALWLQQDALKKTEPKPSERYLRNEMQRVAEAVLVAIDPDVDVAIEESES